VPDISKFGALLKVWHIFPSAANLFKCGALFKCAAVYQVLHICSSVAHFSKFFAFLEVRRTFPRVAHFFKSGAFYRECFT